MFEARRNRNTSQSLWSLLEITFHTTVRRIRAGHRYAVLGLLQQALQSVLMIGVFLLLFQFLGMRSSPIRGDFILYIMSGVFVYMTHIKAVGAVAGAEGPTSAMMHHAPMNTIISLAASALSALYMQLLSMFAILLLYHLVFGPITIDRPVLALGFLIMAWMSGCAVGLVLFALAPWFPTLVAMIRTIYTRLNMIASGKMFVASTLPAYMLPLFLWNPLFHIIDQIRGAVFLHYTPHVTSPMYPVYVTICLIMIGLLGEFTTRKQASLSWFATR